MLISLTDVAGVDVAKSVQITTQYYPCPPVEGQLQAATECLFEMPLPTSG
jgi:hypothetical protein